MQASACWVFGRCGPLHFCLEKCGSDQAGSVFNELDAPLVNGGTGGPAGPFLPRAVVLRRVAPLCSMSSTPS